MTWRGRNRWMVGRRPRQRPHSRGRRKLDLVTDLLPGGRAAAEGQERRITGARPGAAGRFKGEGRKAMGVGVDSELVPRQHVGAEATAGAQPVVKGYLKGLSAATRLPARGGIANDRAGLMPDGAVGTTAQDFAGLTQFADRPAVSPLAGPMSLSCPGVAALVRTRCWSAPICAGPGNRWGCGIRKPCRCSAGPAASVCYHLSNDIVPADVIWWRTKHSARRRGFLAISFRGRTPARGFFRSAGIAGSDLPNRRRTR